MPGFLTGLLYPISALAVRNILPKMNSYNNFNGYQASHLFVICPPIHLGQQSFCECIFNPLSVQNVTQSEKSKISGHRKDPRPCISIVV